MSLLSKRSEEERSFSDFLVILSSDHNVCKKIKQKLWYILFHFDLKSEPVFTRLVHGFSGIILSMIRQKSADKLARFEYCSFEDF